MRGNISGRQSLTYGVGETPAYSAPSGEKTAANEYQPRLVAKVAHIYDPWRIKYFQVRTRSSINMTATMRNNLALMGGTGALIGSLLTMKETAIYRACIAAKPRQVTLRAFLAPIIRDSLANKEEYITIAPDVQIVNPWISSAEPNVPVPATIIVKFDSVLGGGEQSPYSAEATAALRAAFTDAQWTIIKEYGVSHSEIVPYMNAYATEDPKIAYSLVQTLGVTRWIEGDGNQYIDTGVLGNSSLNLSAEMNVVFTSGNAVALGSRNGTNGRFGMVFIYQNAWYLGVDGSDGFIKSVSMNTIYHYKGVLGTSGYTFYENGVQIATGTATCNSNLNMYLFAYNYNGGRQYQMSGKIDGCVIKSNDIIIRSFIPFIHDDNGTKKNGMLDLVSGTFYHNAGTGSFTIYETPAN